MKKSILAVAVLTAIASMALAAATDIGLTKVAPRVFSPGEGSATINRVRFSFGNSINSDVAIRIFDTNGALIRRNLERESETVLFWDGRDQDGRIVSSGVYIYQVEADAKVSNGTVVVAR